MVQEAKNQVKVSLCEQIIKIAKEILKKHASRYGMGESHGFDHCTKVHDNMLKAIKSGMSTFGATYFTPEQKLAL